MTINLNKCRLSPSGFIHTPKGRLSHAKFLIEGQENKKGKIKYNGNILIPPDKDLKMLKNKAGSIALDKCDGDKNRAKKLVEKRFLDPNDKPGGGKPEGEAFEGWVLIRASSSSPVDFFYPNGKKIPSDEVAKEAYSGRWCTFLINPYWMVTDENTGVFFGLQGVQLLDHDENIGGGKPDVSGDFDAVDGETGGKSSGASESVDDMFA
jgi:hypothetical protein